MKSVTRPIPVKSVSHSRLPAMMALSISLTAVFAFTLALGEDVSGRVLLPVGAPRRKAAQHARVQLGQGADAQGQRLVYKRRPHIVHLEGGRGFAVQQQNLIACF